MTRRRIVLFAALALLSGAWLAGHAVGGLDVGLLHLLPAIAILLPLLAGRYLGADTLVAARLPRPVRIVPRGGRLIAASLAERGPPALLPARS